jgi:site-specific DNA recombinase
MKIGIYARESDKDTTKAPPIEAQIERGRQWAKENNHEVIEVLQDNGFSGGDWKRPAWNQVLKSAKGHRFSILWVWNQDRIARDTEQFLYFYRTMTKLNCQIYEDTAHEFIDMETLGGRVKHQALAQASEIFRLVTSQKIRQVAAKYKAAGKPWGRQIKNLNRDAIIKMKQDNPSWGWRLLAKKYYELYGIKVAHNTIRNVIINSSHVQSDLNLNGQKEKKV